MPNHPRVLDLLVKGKDEAVAITGTERQPLTYSDLQRQIEKTISQLNQLGVGRFSPFFRRDAHDAALADRRRPVAPLLCAAMCRRAKRSFLAVFQLNQLEESHPRLRAQTPSIR